MIRRLRRSLLRLRQWRAALKLAGKQVSWLAMFKAMRTGKVDAKTYAHRLRICARCPVYDRERKLCRKEHLSIIPVPAVTVLGCGCYVPFKAKTVAPYQGQPQYQPWKKRYGYVMTVRGCWGHVTMGGTFGWGEPPYDPEVLRNTPLSWPCNWLRWGERHPSQR